MQTNNITIEGLRAAIDAIKRPIQYYATNDALPVGKYFMFAGDWYWPATLIMHPADFEERQGELSRYCRLTHLREWQPNEGQVRRAWEETRRAPLAPVFLLSASMEFLIYE